MALADLTFKLYNDSLLTSPFTGTLQLTHESDLSDNPQDFQYYFGSAETAGARTLEAVSNPGVDQITITPTDGLADWAATTAYALGDTVEPTTPNTYRYECTTAGTSGSGEPTFPTSGIGSTVVDGTVVWTLVANRHELTEIKLATTSGGLPGATAGAALNLGTSILSGSANAVEVHIRVTNAVTQVSNNTGNPEITLDINSVQET
tara:strand:- start:19863 stop:20480 length:618 start_codon:yes stop_codon:yes gene_type:complete